MKKLLIFLGALAAYGTDCTISDTVRTPFGGYFAGRIVVALNSPASAQPLYSGSQTLTGWQTTIEVPSTANGVVAFTLVCTDTITPSGTSYSARYQPTSGSGWAETWSPTTGTTTIRAMRATTVPTPTTTFQASQLALAAGSMVYGSSAGVGTALAAGTNGQVLALSGGYPAWTTNIAGNAGTATALAANGTNCAAGTFPLGVDASGNSESCTALPTTISGTANQITASASTGAVTLSLPATITGLTSVTSTGFTGTLTGNASTATALASTVASGRLWIGQGTGVPTSDSSASWDSSIGRATFRAASNANSVPLILSAPVGGTSTVMFQADNAAKTGTIGVDSAGNMVLSHTTAGSMYFDHYSEVIFRSVSASYATRAKLVSNGNLLLGTTTDLGYGLAAQKTGSTGTLLAKDPTSVTGFTRVLFDLGAADTASTEIFRINGTMRFGGTNTTGAGSAALGSNSPATTNTAPYTWIRAVAADGSTVYIPAWK